MNNIRELAVRIVVALEHNDPHYTPAEGRTTNGYCSYCNARGYNFERSHSVTCPAVFARAIIRECDQMQQIPTEG